MNILNSAIRTGLTILSLPVAFGADTYLWITELVPSTGQVEVTNVGSETVTTPSAYPFCHRFNYTNTVPGGLSFSPGESKVFTVSLSNPADSDLWLYRNDSDFANAANMIAGLKWGPAPNVGRVALASTNGKWSGAGSFVPAPAAGMALQLTGPDPFSHGNWSEGVPDLGSYSPPAPTVTATKSLVDDSLVLTWSGGAPPYRVRSSMDLTTWKNEGPVNAETSRSFDTGAFGDRAFFQVISGVFLEPTTNYRITFTSTWSRSIFQTVPTNDHFSGMIGGTHNDQSAFWAPGQLASSGIESMAETGSKTSLTAEVNAAISAGTGDVLLSGNGLGANGSQAVLEFTASRSHPLLTLVSMVAPSPDWFVGVHDVSLLAEDDEWIESATFELFPYDAGSDDGLDFTSPNAESSPHVPIALIADTPPFAVQAGVGGGPRPIATFVIVRQP